MNAFPNPTLRDPQSCSEHLLNDDNQYGMTLRDYFAAKAMQSILLVVLEKDSKSAKKSISYLSELAFEVADDMLRIR